MRLLSDHDISKMSTPALKKALAQTETVIAQHEGPAVWFAGWHLPGERARDPEQFKTFRDAVMHVVEELKLASETLGDDAVLRCDATDRRDAGKLDAMAWHWRRVADRPSSDHQMHDPVSGYVYRVWRA